MPAPADSNGRGTDSEQYITIFRNMSGNSVSPIGCSLCHTNRERIRTRIGVELLLFFFLFCRAEESVLMTFFLVF